MSRAGVEILSPGPAYTPAGIAALLRRQGRRAGGDSGYAGRPVTELITDGHDFIKLRTEYSLPERDARRFIEQAIEREAAVGVHPHTKCWFLVHVDESETPVIGNITPHLQPLDGVGAGDDGLSADRFLELLCAVVDMYLHVTREHGLVLDLGLSNFALDAGEQVFYLDDQFYPRDELSALPEFLAALLRSQAWLDTRLAGLLGAHVRSAVLADGQDAHAVTVIAEEVRSAFVAQQAHEARAALVGALQGEDGFSWQPHSTSPVMALFADIHSNAPALQSALDYLAGRDIDHCLVLGDVVGYGPHPQACIDLLRAQDNFSFIRGNHDHAVATGHMVAGSTSLAGWTINWTVAQLDEEVRRWLGTLPPYLQQDDWLAVHGSPRDRTFFNAYVYQMTYSENLDELASRRLRLCFHGHTHIQKIYYREKGTDGETQQANGALGRATQALICPGSIGQPRGGEAGAEFAILNMETLEIEFHRLSYDLDTTVRDMQRARFPEALATRLRLGQ